MTARPEAMGALTERTALAVPRQDPARDAVAFPAGAVVRIRRVPAPDPPGSLIALIDDATAAGLILRAFPAQDRCGLADGQRIALRRHGAGTFTGVATLLAVRAGDPTLYLTGPVSVVAPDRSRGLYRVPSNLDAVIDGRRWHISDISGNGALLVGTASHAVRPGSPLRLSLQLPGGGLPVRVIADAVRVLPRGDRQAVGVEFVDLTRQQQDAIVRYVYQRQKELLRQGLLRA